MIYVVHIREKHKKQWHFCKKFDSYSDAYKFLTYPKTYLYNGRYYSVKSRFYRISVSDTSIFCEPDYFLVNPCFCGKIYKFNHVDLVSYEEILENE